MNKNKKDDNCVVRFYLYMNEKIDGRFKTESHNTIEVPCNEAETFVQKTFKGTRLINKTEPHIQEGECTACQNGSHSCC
jgi:hypothetical protein